MDATALYYLYCDHLRGLHLPCMPFLLSCPRLSFIHPLFSLQGVQFPCESATSFTSTYKHAQGHYTLETSTYLPMTDLWPIPMSPRVWPWASSIGIAWSAFQMQCNSQPPPDPLNQNLCVWEPMICFKKLSSDSETHRFEKCCLDSMSLLPTILDCLPLSLFLFVCFLTILTQG